MEYKLPEVWFQCVKKEVIGTGAYGTVYRIEDPDHNISAVKVLNIPSNDEEAQTIKYEMKDPKLVREYFTNLISDFMREIQIMETLKDTTNVVHLKSHYLESNAVDEKWTIYIQMEMLTSLARYCSSHVMPEEEVIRLGIDILKAIRDCNKKDIIHRDIKPYNIMVTEDGTFKLGDFGIARHVEKTGRSLSIRGTFSYMAPEVFHGESYDKTVDLYSLGLVMYRLMNKNRDPFVSTSKKLIYYKDKEEALKQRMEGKKIPPPVNASEELTEIILRACAYNVEDRYQCAEDMLKDLLGLQLGIYIKGRSLADHSTVRRIRLMARKKRYELLTILFFFICLAGAASFGHFHKPKAAIREWKPEQVSIEKKIEREICEWAKDSDDLLWTCLEEDDMESFLEKYPDYNEDEYRKLYKDYYLLENSKEFLKENYDKYITQYQKRSRRKIHIIKQIEDAYYVEVTRSYIASDPYKSSISRNEIQEYYQGNLLQCSVYYYIRYDNGAVLFDDLMTVRTDRDSEYNYINDIVVPFEKIPFAPANKNDHSMYDEVGYLNYLYMDSDFVYDDFFRINVIDDYVNEENKTISFVISIKNGTEKNITVDYIYFDYDLGESKGMDEYPGDEEEKSLNIISKAGTSTCYVLTYKIHDEEKTDIDLFKQGYVYHCRYETSLRGVRKNDK